LTRLRPDDIPNLTDDNIKKYLSSTGNPKMFANAELEVEEPVFTFKKEQFPPPA